MTPPKKFRMTRGFLVRVIRQLEQQELIIRGDDYIFLTAKGKALIQFSATRKKP